MTGLSPSSLRVTGADVGCTGEGVALGQAALEAEAHLPYPFLEGGRGHISMSTSPPDW